MVGHAGEIMALGNGDQRLPVAEVERPGAAHVDVEALQRRRDDNVERLVERNEHDRRLARHVERLGEAGVENGALVDGDDGMRARLHVAEFDPLAAAGILMDAGVEGGAAASRAMRIDERQDVGVDLGARQALDHEAALPVGIGRPGERLHGAAAAGREIFAERGNPVGAGRQNFDEPGAVAIDFGAHDLAGQGIGHGDHAAIVPGEAFAALAKPRDGEFRVQVEVSHVRGFSAAVRNSTFPSPPVIGEGVTPSTFQP